jgi:RimJ/RimL family protein N-acetyltransferase
MEFSLRFTALMLLHQHWPLFELRVRTPRLELRYPTDTDVAEIAERSVTEGVHDPTFMPFTVEWTDVPAPLQQRRSLQHHWSLRANWEPTSWHCNFAVAVDDRIVGTQSALAENFATLHAVTTGSFLFQPYQGMGIGTEMRSAILHLVFAGLGAEIAQTGAWEDNVQSLGVTRKLGYELEGHRRALSRGLPRELVGYRLTRDAWETRRRDDIIIEGLEPCLELFGLNSVAQESMDAEADGS